MSFLKLDVSTGKNTVVRDIKNSSNKITYMNREYEPYYNLANAIVVRAFTDYRKALKKLKKMGKTWPMKKAELQEEIRKTKDDTPVHQLLELEEFFESGWYSILTNANAEYIMSEIYEEVYGDV